MIDKVKELECKLSEFEWFRKVAYHGGVITIFTVGEPSGLVWLLDNKPPDNPFSLTERATYAGIPIKVIIASDGAFMHNEILASDR